MNNLPHRHVLFSTLDTFTTGFGLQYYLRTYLWHGIHADAGRIMAAAMAADESHYE